MIKAERPTAVALRELLEYDPTTGLVTWKHSTQQTKAGTEAGSKYPSGYRVIGINYARYPAHVLAWVLHTGTWPRKGFEIDHENGIRDANHFSNLREATRAQNQHNKVGHGASGFKGVTFCKRENKFVASIRKNGRNRHLGYFTKPEEASTAYAKAAQELFGKFATIRHR